MSPFMIEVWQDAGLPELLSDRLKSSGIPTTESSRKPHIQRKEPNPCKKGLPVQPQSSLTSRQTNHTMLRMVCLVAGKKLFACETKRTRKDKSYHCKQTVYSSRVD